MVSTEKKASLQIPFFADLVVLAGGLNPFPYRTRPLNPSAPMVLSLKAWKSRSLPGLPRTDFFSITMIDRQNPLRETAAGFLFRERRSSSESLVDRHAIALHQPVGLVCHADHGHQFGEHR